MKLKGMSLFIRSENDEIPSNYERFSERILE